MCETCRGYHRERARRRYRNDKERVLEGNRRWRQNNADLCREVNKRWRGDNSGHLQRYIQNWRENNVERVRELDRRSNQRRRARKRGATVENFTREQLRQYWIENGIDPEHCIYCGGPHEHDDHAIPLARGGTHERANIVPSCAFCNYSKGTKLLEEWRPNVA